MGTDTDKSKAALIDHAEMFLEEAGVSTYRDLSARVDGMDERLQQLEDESVEDDLQRVELASRLAQVEGALLAALTDGEHGPYDQECDPAPWSVSS